MSGVTNVPTLHTERLALRAIGARDVPAMLDFYSSGRAAFMGGPLAANDAWRKVAAYLGHWRLRGDGMWMLEARADGALVGMCGVAGWPAKPEPEIGWLALEGGEGQGLIAEAVRAVLAHVRDALGWDRAVSFIAPGNARSVALARRLGAVNEGHSAAFSKLYDEDHDCWRHDLPVGVPARRVGETALRAIPTIRTERLVLRPFTADDHAALSGFFARGEDGGFAGGPHDADTTFRRMACWLGHWDLKGWGLWAIEAGDGLAGYCGSWQPMGFPEREIGWGLMPHARGRGLGAEAARAAIREARKAEPDCALVSYVSPDNAPSSRLAGRLGALDEGPIDFGHGPARVWRHPVAEGRRTAEPNGTSRSLH